MESYIEELKELHHRRVAYIVLGGSLILLLFSVLDYFMVPEMYGEFLTYRIGAALFGFVLFIANSFDSRREYPFLIGLCWYLFVVGIIMVMIYRMGGVTSPYYVGLIIAVTLYVTLAPLTPIQTLSCGGLVVACYILTILLKQQLTPVNRIELFSNLFFITCFILIVATQSWADTAARQSEYLLRAEERSAAEELKGHVAGLEIEVEKRSREQEVREKQYQLLFDQIADGVVVLSSDGIIVQANMAFNVQYGREGDTEGTSFYDLSPLTQHEELERIFADISIQGLQVSDGHIKLINRLGEMVEVEVNGNVLQRQGVSVGILLIIRDLSARKEMERRLVRSLEIQKRTETSAILVLAKLSEFKDLTPDNHLERIREYCRLLAVELSAYEELNDVMTTTYIEDIYHASILHDIGKVAIPDEYMAGDAPLEEYEKDYIRRHTLIGGNVIKEMEQESEGSGFLSMAKHIAYFHHERWDGKGYPYGLDGREIPLAARIMALADCYEEKTASGEPGTVEDVHQGTVEYIIRQSGTMLDPLVVDGFLAIQDTFREVMKMYPANPGDVVKTS